MELSLTGKTALVCGSTQGIGLASAIEISRLGASCMLLSRNEEKLRKVLEGLDTSGQQVHGLLVADFSNPNSVIAALTPYLREHTVHILVNNGGGPPGGPITEAREDAFISAFRQHLICNHLLAQAVLPGMKQVGYGRIINIISTSVKTPIRNLGVSNTTRWAVAAWSKTLAGEVGRFGITVNNVLPGYTNTERLRSLLRDTARQRQASYESVEEQFLKEIPAGRFGEAKEIAAMVAFLASPAASFVNGASIPVDGGQTPSV